MFAFNLGMIFNYQTQVRLRTCYLQRAWLGILLFVINTPGARKFWKSCQSVKSYRYRCNK